MSTTPPASSAPIAPPPGAAGSDNAHFDVVEVTELHAVGTAPSQVGQAPVTNAPSVVAKAMSATTLSAAALDEALASGASGGFVGSGGAAVGKRGGDVVRDWTVDRRSGLPTGSRLKSVRGAGRGGLSALAASLQPLETRATCVGMQQPDRSAGQRPTPTGKY